MDFSRNNFFYGTGEYKAPPSESDMNGLYSITATRNF